MYTKIIGTGSYLPEQVRTNADLEKMVDTSDEWIVTRTGIRERHIAAPNETVSTMDMKQLTVRLRWRVSIKRDRPDRGCNDLCHSCISQCSVSDSKHARY